MRDGAEASGDAGGPPLVGIGALTPAQDHVRDERRPGIVHLGLGAFHRSHQAWYTQHVASDEEPWGIAAFTGRRPDQAELLARQNAVYTLITRAADGDTAEFIDAVIEAHDGADTARWREALADPRTGVVTLTVTEAAYHRAADGGIDVESPVVRGDLALLRDGLSDTACTTAPGRLLDGLRARRDASGGPLAVVCCDNLTDNGRVVRDVVMSLAEAADPALAAWILSTVSFVSSMVDRITPATTEGDRADALALTGFDDAAVVVAEPFAEWVLSGDFPAGRPAWETAGAHFVDDLEPYEQRKLWLLNAGHSLLAYLGLHLGHETIDEAMRDPRCTEPLERLWDEAARELPLPAAEIAQARASLQERFENPRIRHRLRQIASDGSVKLPVRVVDPLRRRLARGEPIGDGAATALAAWWLHVTRQRSLVSDAAAASLPPSATVSDVLALVAPGLDRDAAVEAAVTAAAERILQLPSSAPTPTTTGVPA
ncbi:mannitol dehydrogenase [Frondihabitans sucicola]|uniref:Mannitol-1-phosphate 5-dehydrogenase n=1 Tax=Frondihabitans sucicola TaxID=1268041 RepID=A0ABN6Y2S6_9MICO|nr:mannitol dehydrogenase family protein [Frondihabitans sucicola]BDZ50387.1 mannitol dehydrogenase [Frondihabitans sucicola]